MFCLLWLESACALYITINYLLFIIIIYCVLNRRDFCVRDFILEYFRLYSVKTALSRAKPRPHGQLCKSSVYFFVKSSGCDACVMVHMPQHMVPIFTGIPQWCCFVFFFHVFFLPLLFCAVIM